MCYHVSTAAKEKFDAYVKDYNVVNYAFYYHASGYQHPALPITTTEDPTTVNVGVWGFVPPFIQDSMEAKKYADMTLNAKSEEIFEKRSYKPHILQRRCLVWVDGFYEWQWKDEKGKEKIPHYLYMKGHVPFTLGGVYSNWVNPVTAELLHTVSIITTAANTLMAEIHNNKKRMPFIVAPEDRQRWVSDISKEDIAALMQPYPEGHLCNHTISKLITSRKDNPNQPAVQEPFEYDKTNLF